MPLSAAGGPFATPSSGPKNDSSARQVDQSSRQSSPDVPLRQVARKLSQASTLKRALTVDTAMANTAPVMATTASTSSINAPEQDASTEPDLFQQLLDASVEPLSAEDVQSAQAILEASSSTTQAPHEHQTSPEQASRRCVSYTSPYPHFIPVNPDPPSERSLSAISPRTTMPFMRPPPPMPDRARHASTSAVPASLVLRSNSPPRSAHLPRLSSARILMPTPPSPRRQSLIESTYASQQIRVCNPRIQTAIPQSAPPAQVVFNYRPSVVQASNSYVPTPSVAALSNREKAMLAQQFVETGGLGGLPLRCSLRTCDGD